MLELESAEGAASVLAGYDRSKRAWSFARKGEFWEAVAEAHRRGHRGAGKRVAIVDSAFDLEIAQLHEASGGSPRLRGKVGEPDAHGSAVALLLLAVAPEARLDLYEVTADGRPDPYAVRAALREIAASPPDAICLSLGSPLSRDRVDVWPDDDVRRAGSTTERLDVLLAAKGRQEVNVRECPLSVCLCNEADLAARAGPIVLAAAGNSLADIFCPALADGVVSTGFQLDFRRPTAGGAEAAFATLPGFPQSLVLDLGLKQPENVLGSSFATPLAAGAALLGFDRSSLPGMIASGRLGSVADRLLGRDDLHTSDAQHMFAMYREAVTSFPHQRELVESDHWCMGCAIFGTSLFINAGLALLRAGNLDLGERLLRIGRVLAPENPHAAANLARLLWTRVEKGEPEPRRKALCREALSLYDRAIALRSGYKGYDATRADIAAAIP